MQPAVETSLEQEELVARARALAPALSARAREAEEGSAVPAESVREIVDAGLVRIGTPVRFGGLDVEFETAHQVTIELGRACGSTAWCYQLWALHGYWTGYWPMEAQEDLYSDGPDMLSSSVHLGIDAGYERVADGFRVWGRGKFASGVDHAHWVFAVVMGAEGPMQFLIPRSELEIVDDSWDVAGLCATGSKEVGVTAALVPAHRAIHALPPIDFEPHRHPLPYEDHPQRRYTVPMITLMGWDFPAVAIGLAQGAVDEISERLRGTIGSVRSADSPVIQSQVAESAIEIHTARALLHQDLDDTQTKGERGERLTQVELSRAMATRSYGHNLAISAVNRMFALGGGRSLSRNDPLQRIHRDANASSHPGTLGQFALGSQPFGRALLDLDPSEVNLWTGPKLG